MRTLKLGTRRSLLAWAQSSWVAREIERLNPGFKVELVGIDTRGDKILDVSLKSVAGKEFFVAELDDALKSGSVDLTVHSMKDLSLDRPSEFVLAAIPRRANPRDVVLFGPGVFEKIAAGKTLKVGTSSPRRVENIPAFLERALPTVEGRKPRTEFVEIRGNVNTRLSRVHEPEGSPKQLDAVVLAFAGLIRLWADQAGQVELERLLRGVRWMVLPLKECPAAPAQGALAVECRAQDAVVRQALGKLHNEATAGAVARERGLLAEWGGGCHQKFGATCIPHPELDALFYVRGKKPDQTFIDEMHWSAPKASAKDSVRAWDGAEWRARLGESAQESLGVSLPEGTQTWFIAHSRALSKELAPSAREARIWTSGTPSWFRLAEQGVWVEGCTEGLGFEPLSSTLSEPVLQLPELASWTILTHQSATETWPQGRVLATYRLESPKGAQVEQAKSELQGATDIYWSSGSQFDLFGAEASVSARHACGPGKTAQYLRQKRPDLQVQVFPSAEEWRKWLNTQATR